MDRQHLINEIDSARTELQRLRDERTRLQPGDRDGGARFRGLIATAAADLADLESELKDFDTNEAGAARKAERAHGRAAAAAAIDIASDTALWSTLSRQLADARATARKLAERGKQAASHVSAVLRSHSAINAAEGSRAGLLLPPAAGSDSGTVEALALELKSLIESCPGNFRLTAEWLLPNHYAFSPATPGPRPSLLDARQRAAENLRAQLQGLCAEPRVVHEEIAR